MGSHKLLLLLNEDLAQILNVFYLLLNDVVQFYLFIFQSDAIIHWLKNHNTYLLMLMLT